MSKKDPGVETAAEATSAEKSLNRRNYLKAAAVGAAGAGAAALAMPTIANA